MNPNNIDFVLLIPCYNNLKGLTESLKSISYQFERFEVLIVDDGSKVPITRNDMPIDPSMVVHILRFDQNQGIVTALNAGLTALKSRIDFNYIARLDAGDTCDQQRFYKQVNFLNQHKEIMLLGSWARFQHKTSAHSYDYITKTTQEEIEKEMHYKCSFIHPSVMFRKEILDSTGFYPDTFPHAEDYAFFWKILKQHKGAVIPEKLVQITYSDASVSAENYTRQLRSRKKIVKEFGDDWLRKRIGSVLLSLKLILPRKLITALKS
ncbi:MAG TPA: glycosyltransferase [Bacteroidia bacterium]|jgi:glycosyltransferase involved in cell wall biosynthesis|nr:glycosyltransferase [Bacteroidia bacterium]